MSGKTGIGLRAPHVDSVLETRPDVGFLEAHAENYFRTGGIPFEQLMQCRTHYPLSLHGVGLSLGSADGISAEHLQKLKSLVKTVDPLFVSEHVSWSGVDGKFTPDLLPLPMTEEALAVICENIGIVQNELARKILVENPSTYLALDGDMSEPEFIKQIIQRTGCGLLLDVNNIYVSTHNLGTDPLAYLAALPSGIVGEIHLAGYQDNDGVYVDAHNHPVYDAVWDLYRAALQKFGDAPTLVEWDNDLPPLQTLVAEAKKADKLREAAREKRRADAA